MTQLAGQLSILGQEIKLIEKAEEKAQKERARMSQISSIQQ